MTQQGPQTPSPKTTLFCPQCSHRSPYDGDWHVVESRSRVRYRCPECRAMVLSQSTPSRRPAGPGTVLQAWHENLRAWNQFWWDSLTES